MKKAKYTDISDLEIVYVDKQGNIVRRFDEWNKLLNAGIIDPDGFDRTGPFFDERYYTEEEFRWGWGLSTCFRSKDE